MIRIESGSGTGNVAKVGADFRLQVRSITVSNIQEETNKGNAYDLHSGLISITGTSASGLLYFKNNEDRDFHISVIAVGITAAAGGFANSVEVTVVRNPTAGTLISNATPIQISQNRNFGSTNTLTATVYKGVDGATMTDGDEALIFVTNGQGRLAADVDIVVPKGASFGIKVDPNLTSGATTAYAAVVGFLNPVV
jgi:hypothetical protein